MNTPSHNKKPTASTIVASGRFYRVESLSNALFLLHVHGLQDRTYKTLGEALSEGGRIESRECVKVTREWLEEVTNSGMVEPEETFWDLWAKIGAREQKSLISELQSQYRRWNGGNWAPPVYAFVEVLSAGEVVA